MFAQKARKDEAGQSGGEEEPEEENHTPLPPPMQIIKDPNNPEVNTNILLRFLIFYIMNIMVDLCLLNCNDNNFIWIFVL